MAARITLVWSFAGRNKRRGEGMTGSRTSSSGPSNGQQGSCETMVTEKKQWSRRQVLQGGASLAAVGLLAVNAPEGTSAAALAKQTADATPQAGGTLTISVAQITSNSHLLFLRHYAGSENIYTRLLVQSRLITLNHERTDFVGDLAETFTFSDDGKTITFNLRPGLTWHDGEPFSATDVSFTFHMI